MTTDKIVTMLENQFGLVSQSFSRLNKTKSKTEVTISFEQFLYHFEIVSDPKTHEVIIMTQFRSVKPNKKRYLMRTQTMRTQTKSD